MQDRATFEQGQRLAAGAVGIEDRADLAVGIQRQKFPRVLVALVEIDEMRFIR